MMRTVKPVHSYWTVALVCFFAVIIAQPCYALDPINKNFLGLAIKGTDPVSYFTEGRPVKGKSNYTYKWKDAEWRFSSEENLSLFKGSPEKYAPQFGGYCAWAVSQGYTAGIDPEAWKIVEGKLYLNYSLRVQKKWSQDIPGNIQKAEKNWPELLSQ
jgi:YHS domain-containing protein